MRKALSIIVSVILVALLCVTGVFADSSDTMVVFEGGTDTPEFSQVIAGYFSQFNFTSEFLSSHLGERIQLFNGVELLIGNGSDNPTFVRVSFLLENDTIDYAAALYLIDYDGYFPICFRSYSDGDLKVSRLLPQYASSSDWIYISRNSVNLNCSLLSPSVTVGSSIEYTSSSTISNTYSLVLPYGNALAISSSSAFSISRRAYSILNSTYNYQKYVRASDDFSYRVNGSYQGVVNNSSLTGTFGVNVFGSNNVLALLIPWQPVNQNILGRATDYNFFAGLVSETVSLSSSESFLIWYPYYANNQDTSKLNEVPMQISITVDHSAPIYFTTYPITGSTSSTGEDTYISNTASSTDSGSSSQSDDGDGNVTVTFDNAPTAGGNHGQAPINDNNTILGVLSNLQNTLLGLFNKAIDGIHNLISLGSSFLQSVQVMFSWLPAELLVIITSGFIILLTIGVLKTLWR